MTWAALQAPAPAALLADGLISRSAHLASVEDLTLVPCAGGGGRVLRVRLYDGFEVDVLPERGLDVGAVWFKGRPLSWASPISDRDRLANQTGTQWLTRFNGGLIATCGLENVGPASDGYGLHGGHSHQLASEVRWTSEVTEQGAVVTVSGTIDSVEMFGRRVYVYRTITVRSSVDGEPSLVIRDRVRNEGVLPAKAALLYHVNFGAPAILPGTRIVVASERVSTREPCQEVPFAETLPELTDVMTEAVFEYHGVAEVDGTSSALVSTPSFGRDIEVSWSAATLPRFCQWVFPTRGGWALGLEPTNSPTFGPDRATENDGARILAPGEEFETQVRIRLLRPASVGGPN